MPPLHRITWAFAILALGYGVWNAVTHAWVCDDAFISYRYAENAANGLGLVYNAGERVEGYTNFLWVVILTGGILAGLDPILFSQVLGVGFFVATIAVVGAQAYKTRSFPVAALGLGLHTHLAYFATCGLETSMFTFWVTCGVVLLAYAARPRTFLLSGLALILATMTRPDGAVAYAGASVVVGVLALRARRIGFLVGFALPFLAVYLPYFLWKYSYYGFPFPNTFYAKSASRPFLDQGLYYVWLYLSCYWYLIPGLFAPLWMLARRRGEGRVLAVASRQLAWCLVALCLPFLAYVVWVGGDFMFSRFCLPITPALLLGCQLLAVGRHGWLIVAMVSCGSFLNLYPIYTAAKIQPANARNVVEERDHYPGWYVEAYRILGETLSRRTEGVDLRIAIGGGQAMFAYFGRFSHVLEIHGLTDTRIAHQELSERGRIGHEKALPLDHPYYREQRISMIVGAYQQLGIPGDRLADQRRFEFYAEDVPFLPAGQPNTGFAQATLLMYDAPVMAALAGREGLRFQPFPEYLDSYIAGMAQKPREEVERDLEAFRGFYFDHNDDPERLRRIEAFLGRAP